MAPVGLARTSVCLVKQAALLLALSALYRTSRVKKKKKSATDILCTQYGGVQRGTGEGPGTCRIIEDRRDVIENRRIMFAVGSISVKSGLNVFK